MIDKHWDVQSAAGNAVLLQPLRAAPAAQYQKVPTGQGVVVVQLLLLLDPEGGGVSPGMAKPVFGLRAESNRPQAYSYVHWLLTQPWKLVQ